MSVIVPRTCTEVRYDESGFVEHHESRPLESFRDESAYVLLGDPGSGKSTSFNTEHEALEGGGCFVTARDFLTFDVQAHPEWRERTLFIDGLDEVRAGVADPRPPFDGIRGKLDQLGRPRFRLSCREADWLGANDRSNLKHVAPGGRVAVLRLDPLTDEKIARILNFHPGVQDAEEFMAAAGEKGVAEFLGNPLTLDLLAKAVGGAGAWPTSHLELFEAACRRIVLEHNDEHVAALRSLAASLAVADGLTEEALLEAAGHLCVVQLLTGAAGFAMSASGESDRSEGYPAVDECGQWWDGWHAAGQRTGSRVGPLRAVLATKLFSAHGNGRFGPVHRHVAEYLGGRYLARLVGDDRPNRGGGRRGVPLQRVVALMTGIDGMVVTELRGLSAWLAAHSEPARGDLIGRDPIGVTLYGDAAGFSTGEKIELLMALAADSPGVADRLEASFRYPPRSTAVAGALVATGIEPQRALGQVSAAGSLVTPATEFKIREILADPRRDEAHQTFVLFVLRALPYGARLRDLNDVLLELVRGDGWWPGVRRRALNALLHNGGGQSDCEFVESLKALLAEVRAKRVPDPQGDLAGRLLQRLYPGELSPADVWDHLAASDVPLVGSRLWRFWTDRVAKECPDADVAAHLDQLAARRDMPPRALERRGLDTVPLDLLARGLKAHGDQLDAVRLYDWLGVGLRAESSTASSSDETRGQIRSWLEQRPAILRSVCDEGLRRLSGKDTEEIGNRLWLEVGRRLYPVGLFPAGLPADFGLWCLDHAQALAGKRLPLAKALLWHAVFAARTRPASGRISIEILEARTQADSILGALYAELQADDQAAQREEQRYRHERRRIADEQGREHQEKLEHVRAHETALRENRSPPALLHQFALAYFGHLIDAEGSTPADRLRNLFRGDEQLTNAALAGLRGAIFRADLPEVDEIIRLREQRTEHCLALPALASLAMLESAAPEKLDRLDAERAGKALAFHYCDHGPDVPGWYRHVVGSRPALAADALIRCAAPDLRNGREHVSGLYELAYDKTHEQVARAASLPLLRAFPIRSVDRQMTDLSYLLWSALQHAERDALLDLIERKLSRASMDVAQRGHWLAAGLVASPETWFPPTEEFAAGGERRIRRLFALFEDQPLESLPLEQLGVSVLELLIRLAGSTYRPRAPVTTGEVREVTPEMSAADRVQGMIRGLAGLPSPGAGEALETLADAPGLSHWRAELVRARDAQRVIRRDATYRHPNLEQVCRTLNDGPPANAADLWALLVDRLEETADRITNGNTDGWRQYWNEDSHGRPVKPKHEDSCRDALLSDLGQRLPPEEVDAQPEGHYANDKRADIRVFCGGFQVPVEVKNNGSRALWSALRDQLIARYVRDPDTDGYGIYLVLWFGESDEHGRPRTAPSPTGVPPRALAELKERLEAGLTPEEARKIAVCVIDVSAPAPQKR